MSRRVYLIGGGGHGRVLLDALLGSGIAVAGILDPNLKIGMQLYGVAVSGGDDVLDTMSPDEVLLVNGVGANPRIQQRRKVFADLRSRGFEFATVRHISAVISCHTRLGSGCQVMAGAALQAGVELGDNAVINTSASVDHDCCIEPHAFIAPGAVLSGDVMIEAGAFVGAGAVVLPGIRIGAAAVVGAGAVVTKDVAAHWIVAGNPAARIGANQ